MLLKIYKNITFLVLLFILTASCAGSFDSVKRGITGSKENSTDEFLVKKKDPLILPPDFESLPTPDERAVASEGSTLFKKTSETLEEGKSTQSSTENSILKKIQNK
jgi:hypothetical protein